MIHAIPYLTDNFNKLVRAERTAIDMDKSFRVKANDYIAVNEWLIQDGKDEYGRCCIARVTDVIELEQKDICSVNPCRIEEHNRIPMSVYGNEE